MADKYWSELNYRCPIDLDRIAEYSREFDSNIPNSITLENLDKCKESVLNARAKLDSMITTLIQLLYDNNILNKSEDKIVYAWLIDNMGRYMKRLDDEEFNLVVKLDGPTKEDSEVGISRVSTYSKILKIASDTLIYESLLKATNEYNELKEKLPRKFLYILFQILSITLSIMGGLTREKSGGITKRGMVQTIPTTWQSLMTNKGQEIIKEGYKQDTGINIDDFHEDLKDLSFEEDLEDEDEH